MLGKLWVVWEPTDNSKFRILQFPIFKVHVGIYYLWAKLCRKHWRIWVLEVNIALRTSHYLTSPETQCQWLCKEINPKINIGFPNGPFFRYGNFFIPRVENPSKISPRAKNIALPRAVGPREARFFSHGLIFEGFSTRGMKKFSYLKTMAHSEILFL